MLIIFQQQVHLLCLLCQHQDNLIVFFLNSISVNEIAEKINNLNTSKSSGPFIVPVKILKLIKEHISIPLATIFNCSISSSTLPDKFKIPSVIPVHKQGSQLVLNNYRPISLLSILNGLLERLVCRRLKDFITKHNLLYEKQFGFRSNHSTLHAVLSIIDKIQNAIEDGNYSCGIFLDLSKAFDTVNHQILLQKLEYYGIRGMANDWFKSYLDNRKQFVSMGGVKSDMLGITCGVPQGSVLGPILFLLYINDFHNCSKILDFHLFADDSNIFYTDKKLSKVESCINSKIKCVSTWLCANKLSLNIEKSSFVIFHPIQKKIGDSFKVIINNEFLKREYKTKYLGVVIDCHLTAVVSKYRLRCVKREKSKSHKLCQNNGLWVVFKEKQSKVKWIYILGTRLQ